MIKIGLLLFASLILLMGIVSAVPDVSIEKIVKENVIISELNNPARFQFIIENKGEKDNFEIYSLVGVSMAPKGTFELESGRNKIEVLVYPDKNIRESRQGAFAFEYQLRGQKSGILKDTLNVKIISLKEVLDISVEPIAPGEEEARINVKNLKNTNLDNLEIGFS